MAALILSFFMFVACTGQSVSGTYVHSSANTVAMLQLVERPNGTLSGSLRFASANRHHEVSVESAPLTGSIDGQNLTLNTPAPPLGFATTFSGVRSGDEITLTYTAQDNVNAISFRRSSPEEFTELTEQLAHAERQRAQVGAQRQADARQREEDEAMRREIPALSTDLEQRANQNAAVTPRINAAAEQFEVLTRRAREAATAGARETDGVRRSQFSVRIIQIRVETTQLGLELDEGRRELQERRADARARVRQAFIWCERTQDAICAPLTSAFQRYNSVLTTNASAFERAAVAQARAEADQGELADFQ
ncbi:MAG: hypothetical protein AB7H66_10240 [Hyphomonadaceae bacterium]